MDNNYHFLSWPHYDWLQLTHSIFSRCCSRNHQRALDSIQASLEAEAKGKAEALRIKKKLEQDINELEVAVDQANRAKADLEKNVKKYQQTIRVRYLFVNQSNVYLSGQAGNLTSVNFC